MLFDQKSYLSPDKLQELKGELEMLKTAKRQEISSRLEEAKKLGDLAENSEYIEAKEAQEQNERAIMELENTVKNAVIIEKVSATDKVQIGSTITVKSAFFQKPEHFTIVGSEEADPASGKISNSSPMGRAFLGRKAGETVDVQTPKGVVKYTIAKII
jgi:transcription elongation factor GreA